ncbi:hypothetical protein M427DRAFT_412004 [Gonapodya prolifera JEL478]|uniref:Uncharacterized protein n=1 Tax=Gonapodya prolifera (strain JEL478) TaxID=1344416 RepID=A0A139A5I6_GONPJ|nr:hypothetical protein M427DRAFT_412004 [Gonapodya prolifera JEL478]|eukprot:KXS12001.1 hypothetical protein M427DRAFT_412004 [Gonapodya prolifera JEL478]
MADTALLVFPSLGRTGGGLKGWRTPSPKGGDTEAEAERTQEQVGMPPPPLVQGVRVSKDIEEGIAMRRKSALRFLGGISLVGQQRRANGEGRRPKDGAPGDPADPADVQRASGGARVEVRDGDRDGEVGVGVGLRPWDMLQLGHTHTDEDTSHPAAAAALRIPHMHRTHSTHGTFESTQSTDSLIPPHPILVHNAHSSPAATRAHPPLHALSLSIPSPTPLVIPDLPFPFAGPPSPPSSITSAPPRAYSPPSPSTPSSSISLRSHSRSSSASSTSSTAPTARQTLPAPPSRPAQPTPLDAALRFLDPRRTSASVSVSATASGAATGTGTGAGTPPNSTTTTTPAEKHAPKPPRWPIPRRARSLSQADLRSDSLRVRDRVRLREREREREQGRGREKERGRERGRDRDRERPSPRDWGRPYVRELFKDRDLFAFPPATSTATLSTSAGTAGTKHPLTSPDNLLTPRPRPRRPDARGRTGRSKDRAAASVVGGGTVGVGAGGAGDSAVGSASTSSSTHPARPPLPASTHASPSSAPAHAHGAPARLGSAQASPPSTRPGVLHQYGSSSSLTHTPHTSHAAHAPRPRAHTDAAPRGRAGAGAGFARLSQLPSRTPLPRHTRPQSGPRMHPR